jgi:hypothetical protein
MKVDVGGHGAGRRGAVLPVEGTGASSLEKYRKRASLAWAGWRLRALFAGASAYAQRS